MNPYRHQPDHRPWWIREVEQAKADSRDPRWVSHGLKLLEAWHFARWLRSIGKGWVCEAFR